MKGLTILKVIISVFKRAILAQLRHGWGVAKLGILAVVLAGLAGLCLGQNRTKVSRRRVLRAPTLKTIQLPTPNLTGSTSLEETLVKLLNVRPFSSQSLKLSEISQLAWAGQGVTKPLVAPEMAASIEEAYPIKLYFTTENGIYLYNPDEHSLNQTTNQDVRSELAATTLSQAMAGCNIIVAGSSRSLAGLYGNKAKKIMYMQAGQAAQSIQLQAASLDLGLIPITDFDTNNIRKTCKLSRSLELLYIISVGYPGEVTPTATGEEQQRTGPRRAVLIVPRENFHDEELFGTMRVLDMAGIETIIASTNIGTLRGILGNAAEARILVNQLRVSDYDAIVFIGGPGVVEYFDNPVALSIAREAADKGKVLAAISIAPAVLANAGVLGGVKATSFLSERNRLIEAGATYTGVPVERDKSIITCSNPMAVTQFGRAIVETLVGR